MIGSMLIRVGLMNPPKSPRIYGRGDPAVVELTDMLGIGEIHFRNPGIAVNLCKKEGAYILYDRGTDLYSMTCQDCVEKANSNYWVPDFAYDEWCRRNGLKRRTFLQRLFR